MPGVYKEKSCKNCGILYRKKGIYCSQSCASKDRISTDGQRENMRRVAAEYNQTPEAIAKQKQINTPLNTLTAEDYTIEIPEFPDLPEGYDIADKW